MKDTEFVCELRARVNKIRLKLSLFKLGFHPFIEGQTSAKVSRLPTTSSNFLVKAGLIVDHIWLD